MDLEAITRRGQARRFGPGYRLAVSHPRPSRRMRRSPPLAELGKRVFFDEAMSATGTQSCASCHGARGRLLGPETSGSIAWGAYEGAVHGNLRQAQAPRPAAYVGSSPVLHTEDVEWHHKLRGGSFGDGARRWAFA